MSQADGGQATGASVKFSRTCRMNGGRLELRWFGLSPRSLRDAYGEKKGGRYGHSTHRVLLLRLMTMKTEQTWSTKVVGHWLPILRSVQRRDKEARILQVVKFQRIAHIGAGQWHKSPARPSVCAHVELHYRHGDR